MKRLLLVLALCLVGSQLYAIENQAYFGMFVDTQVMKIVGMPEMPVIPGMPPMPNMPGVPRRVLNLRLWSPTIAAPDATAALTIPDALKLGKELKLELYRPKAEGGEPIKDDPADNPKFTIKYYWGSSATVKDGQPLVITWKGLSDEEQVRMREEVRRKDSYFYKPNWTTGYWPTKAQPGQIAKGAKLLGHYALKTNYTGNVEFDVPKEVDFLAPIEVTSPVLSKKVALDKAITFKWKAIPQLLGSHAMIMGMIGKDTLIIWSSSETKQSLGMQWDYMQMADVKALVQSKAMMAPEQTEVIVPVGIFKDCDFVNLSMVGYGPGTARDETQPLPRVQSKTTLTIMLGGKKMDEEMGGMDDEEPMDPDDEE